MFPPSNQKRFYKTSGLSGLSVSNEHYGEPIDCLVYSVVFKVVVVLYSYTSIASPCTFIFNGRESNNINNGKRVVLKDGIHEVSEASLELVLYKTNLPRKECAGSQHFVFVDRGKNRISPQIQMTGEAVTTVGDRLSSHSTAHALTTGVSPVPPPLNLHVLDDAWEQLHMELQNQCHTLELKFLRNQI